MDLKNLSHCQQLLQGRQWRFKILVKHHISPGAFSTHGWAGVIEFMRNHHLFQSKVSWVNLRQGWLVGGGEHFKPTPGTTAAAWPSASTESTRSWSIFSCSLFSAPSTYMLTHARCDSSLPFAAILQPGCLFRVTLFAGPVLIFHHENLTGQLPCSETLGESFNPSYFICRSAK